MSAAFRSHGRGTPILRMSFRGVGHIERATGFRDERMLERLKEMLVTLHEANRDDVLRAIKAGPGKGGITLRDAWAFYRTGDWRQIPTAQHALNFRTAFTVWYEQKPVESYRVFARKVLTALGGDFPLSELRERLLRFRTEREQARQGAMWNRTHSKIQAFLRDTLTSDHPLYGEVSSIASLPEAQKRAVNPQTPQDAATIRELLGGEHGRIWWVMCCHGFMPDEFFGGKWAVEDGRVHIKGTKTAHSTKARDRIVPLLVDPFTPTLSQAGFATYLHRAKLGVTAYDARRSYGLWCDLCGFPGGWKKALMGHSQNVTELYGWRESERIANEVEERLKALIRESGGSPVPAGAA